MRQTRWLFMLAVLAGLLVAEAAAAFQQTRIAQTTPDTGMVRQRAPRVPMAPQSGDVDRPSVGRDKAAAPARQQGEQHARNAPDPNRDLPMPKGVPSIIAP